MVLASQMSRVATRDPEAEVTLQTSTEVTLDFVSESNGHTKGTEGRTLTLQFPSKAVDKMINMISPGNHNWLQLNSPTTAVDLPASGATKLRRMLLDTKELIVCPGVFDGLSARTALEVGFDALYMVSYLIRSDWRRSGERLTEECRLEPVPPLRVSGNPTWRLLNSMRCARTPR